MSDANVERWKQEGHFYLWKYEENTRNYPGWHMNSDNEGCRSLAELIDRMLKAQWSSQKLLNVTLPTARVLCVPNNRGGEARWKAPQFLVLKYAKGKVEDDHFIFEKQENGIVLSVGRQMLEQIREGIVGILQGKGDYAIGDRDNGLWFWWQVR